MNEINRLHYRYWIGKLISIIIIVIAAAYFNVPNLVDKISFGLTITSAVLAVLAIYFTTSFNNSFPQNAATLRNVEKDMLHAVSKLNETKLSLDNTLKVLPTSFKEISTKVDRATELIETRMKPSETKAVEKEKSGSEILSEIPWNEKLVFKTFINLPFVVMALLILFSQCWRKSIQIREKEIEQYLNFTSFDMLLGIVSVLGAINLVKSEYVEGVLVIVDVNKILQEKCSEWYDFVIKYSLEKSESHETAKKLENYQKEIDEFIAKKKRA